MHLKMPAIFPQNFAGANESIVWVVDWPWLSRSNLTLKCYITFHFGFVAGNMLPHKRCVAASPSTLQLRHLKNMKTGSPIYLANENEFIAGTMVEHNAFRWQVLVEREDGCHQWFATSWVIAAAEQMYSPPRKNSTKVLFFSIQWIMLVLQLADPWGPVSL